MIYGMLTLPSNMFYTVTLPATLWFFEKGKTDDRVLFLDARRVFTQIDRAHREFTEDQVQNLAVISYLHRGERFRFLERIDASLGAGQERLELCRLQFPGIQATLQAALPPPLTTPDAVALAASQAHRAAQDLACFWQEDTGGLAVLRDSGASPAILFTAEMSAGDIDAHNQSQQAFVGAFTDLVGQLQSAFTALDRGLRDYEKALGAQAEADGKRRPQDRKLREAKAACDEYAALIKSAGEPFGHAHWLQERFPEARYADVIGLCKLATKTEVAAQEYSLNPGRYVGMVIEEDCKTAEEFRADLLALNAELEALNGEAVALAETIFHNIGQLVSVV